VGDGEIVGTYLNSASKKTKYQTVLLKGEKSLLNSTIQHKKRKEKIIFKKNTGPVIRK